MNLNPSCKLLDSGDDSLNEQEIRGFLELYDYRLILVERFYERHLKTLYSYERFVKQILPQWKERKLIKIVQYLNTFALVLEDRGVEVVRKVRDLAENVSTAKGQILRRYYYRPSELEPKRAKRIRYFRYSEFVFDLMEWLNQQQITYTYKDQLHLDQRLKFSQSHGVLVIEGTYEIHLYWNLEQPKDTKQQVIQGYVDYFSVYPEHRCERETYAVFLYQEDFAWLAYRQYHYDTLEPYLNRTFNAFAMMPSEFMTWLSSYLVPKLKLTDELPSLIQQVANKEGYQFKHDYKACPSEINDYEGRLDKPGQQRFFLIDARDYSSAALKQMKWHSNNPAGLSKLHPRKQSLYAIVFTDDEAKMKKWLYQEELLGGNFLAFTTMERLKTMPLLDACHRYNSQGDPTPLRKWIR